MSAPVLLVQANNKPASANIVLQEARSNSQTVAILDQSFTASQLPGAYINVVDNAFVVESLPAIHSSEQTDEGAQEGGSITTYVVQSGDTISSIAKKFSVSQNTIVWANDLRKSTIRIGQELTILPISGVRHTVKKGDTISKLAKKYKADAYDIESYNGFVSGQTLQIGEVLTIPYGSIPKPKKVVVRNSSTKSQSNSGRRLTSWTNTRKVWSNGVFTSALRNTGGPNYDSYYSKPILGYPRSRGLHGNNSVDWGAPRGTAIRAAGPGTVKIAKYGGWNGGYGKYVVINHTNGTQTLYAHMSSVNVYSGQSVSAGQHIGGVGTTGNSTGNHLHFEVRGAKNPWR